MQLKTGFAAALVLAAIAPSFAQSAFAQADVPSSSGNGKAIKGGETTTPSTGSNETLSTKLNKSDGVITPNANVDPAMKVPAPVPQPNSTPVIPPSATGGNSAK